MEDIKHKLATAQRKDVNFDEFEKNQAMLLKQLQTKKDDLAPELQWIIEQKDKIQICACDQSQNEKKTLRAKDSLRKVKKSKKDIAEKIERMNSKGSSTETG